MNPSLETAAPATITVPRTPTPIFAKRIIVAPHLIFRPLRGLVTLASASHGLRRGLHSAAASRLVRCSLQVDLARNRRREPTPKAKNQEPKAESRKPEAESRKPKA